MRSVHLLQLLLTLVLQLPTTLAHQHSASCPCEGPCVPFYETMARGLPMRAPLAPSLRVSNSAARSLKRAHQTHTCTAGKLNNKISAVCPMTSAHTQRTHRVSDSTLAGSTPTTANPTDRVGTGVRSLQMLMCASPHRSSWTPNVNNVTKRLSVPLFATNDYLRTRLLIDEAQFGG